MFGFSSFRAVEIKPVSPPEEDLDAAIWVREPVGEFTNVMTREDMLSMREEEVQKEIEEIYNTQIRTFLPEPANEIAKDKTKNFQHPLLKYNLVGGKK